METSLIRTLHSEKLEGLINAKIQEIESKEQVPGDGCIYKGTVVDIKCWSESCNENPWLFALILWEIK